MVFFDSCADLGTGASYSFLALYPWQVITSYPGQEAIAYDMNGNSKKLGDPFQAIQSQLKIYALQPIPTLPPFQTGLAGYWGYDAGRRLEHLPTPSLNTMFPDCLMGFFSAVLAWDHQARRCWIITNGFPYTNLHDYDRLAQDYCDKILKIIDNCKDQPSRNDPLKDTKWQSSHDEDSYKALIHKIQDYIRAGDVYQVNFAQYLHFQAELEDPLSLYDKLRQAHKAPYSGFLKMKGPFGSVTLYSCSPERFLTLSTDHNVLTQPIKGTRARCLDDPGRDKDLQQDLQQSEKDRAENLMIVDLLRNDLSRVCLPHTVKVPKLFDVQSFPTVHHLVSTIEGVLEPDLDSIDLLKACFPGGSITGAPKIRAMEIITELENAARGPYCGSMAYHSFSGTMDSNILIRTLCQKDNQFFIHAGGGIVIDSDAGQEYRESLAKMKKLVQTVDPRWLSPVRDKKWSL